MKFKEFIVKTPNKKIHSACVDHLIFLGVNKAGVCDSNWYAGLLVYEDGYFYINSDSHSAFDDFPNITLDDFFKLTPDGVRVEPETWHCSFRFDCHVPNWAEQGSIKGFLLRDQIDRIKAVMNEQ